ncbi:hypothetical protein J7I93_01300 [Bacillus sp. ISL-47]|uniref:hypothetical protein n=1 Tax=Bacillus sp. ISL-47 TaxID=2819130 RepID=UPI001BEB88FF|nr:hypothetical protein [Bacillus sp. ISL-47]MBT2686811.1 hypothetical protein [Bacillus sp. ISL-47]MBT2706836.1 hypothetical protein [Pseudomonas sp. ISL-84]
MLKSTGQFNRALRILTFEFSVNINEFMQIGTNINVQSYKGHLHSLLKRAFQMGAAKEQTITFPGEMFLS